MSARLNRFLDAQNASFAGYAAALAEIRAGGKRSHWIWYVFPQLAGLGQSPAAETYGIHGRAEANAYLQHPVLRGRLLEISTAVLDQLQRGVPLATLMGSDIDALKLVSSMTLFNLAAATADEEVADTTSAVLDRAAAEGYPACAFTRSHVNDSR